MKNSILSQNKTMLFFCVSIMCIPFLVDAQSLSAFQESVKTETNSALKIIEYACLISLAIGLVGVIYAFVTKRQDSKEWLIAFLIGCMIYGICKTTFLKAV